jgi:integrase
MNWAAKLGYIDHSPIAHMEKPRPGKREVVISDEQFSELMSFVRDPGFADLIRVTWETGCRPQESLLVEARHVELENSRWVIPEGESKTHIVRVVYLTDEALAITKRQMLRFATGPLFRNAHGNPWNKYSVKNSFDRLRIRMVTQEMHAAGLELKESEITHAISKLKPDKMDRGRRRRKTDVELRREAERKLREKLAKTLAPKYCLYHIRHTWMNRLLRKGVDSLTVAVLAGHQNPSTLAKTYQHLSQDRAYLLEQAKRASRRSPHV